MPAHRLTAKHHRGDTWEVRIDTAHYFSLEDAARALALVYPDDPPWRGDVKLRMGLSQAARERLLESEPPEPDGQKVAAYRELLDERRPKYFKYDNGTRGRFDVATYLDIDKAAQALALQWPDSPARFGRMTAERGLQEAVRRRRLESSSQRADPETVAMYREKLLDVGMFPA